MIEQLLIDPISKKNLTIDYQSNSINHLDKEKFYSNINERVITILPKETSPNLRKSELHLQNNSTFKYLEHYSNDAKYFDYTNLHTHPVTSDEQNRLQETIINQVPEDAYTILDVGCGCGWVSKRLTTEKRKVISMDVSITNPQKAVSSFPHKNHYGLVADAFNLPIKPNSIDCIIASEIMEHISDPQLFIGKLLEALKPEGTLIITTPYDEKIELHLCVNCNQLTPAHAHLHSFNIKNIRNLLPSNLKHVHASTFSNKALLKLRLSYLFRKAPYSIWKLIDKLANRVINKPTRLLLVLNKG